MTSMEPAPKASKITVHVEYDDGTFADIEAVEPAHVAVSDAFPGERPTDYIVISVLPAPGRPPAVSGTAVGREQQREVERWLENSPWYRDAPEQQQT